MSGRDQTSVAPLDAARSSQRDDPTCRQTVPLPPARSLDITSAIAKTVRLMAEPKTEAPAAAVQEIALMEKIVSLCKRKGFVFQSSEIYGGINGFWDYGPLGAELKRNVKDFWWRTMVHTREDVVGLEATIIMHPQIWKASGHVDTFADLMRECPACKKRYRADQVEPRSGRVYRCEGASGAEGKVESAFEVILAKGKPIDSGKERAKKFYTALKVKDAQPFGETFS